MAEIAQSVASHAPHVHPPSNSFKAWKSFGVRWLRVAVALWMLCYYLLPNTVWARWSPGGILFDENEWMRLRTDSSLGSLAVIVFGIAVTVGVAFYSRFKADGGIPIWLWLFAYLLPGYITLINQRSNPILIRSIESVVASICCGIAVALLAGSIASLVRMVCALGSIQALYTIYYIHIGVNGFPSGNILRAGGTFNHPDGVYTLMLVAIPCAINLAFRASQRSSSLYLFFASAMFAALVLTWFRGGMIAAMVSLTWLIYQMTLKPRVALMAAAALLVICFYVSSHRASGFVNEASSRRSVAGHLLLIEQGAVVFKNNWLTGMGIGELSIPVKIKTGESEALKTSVEIEPKNAFLFFLDELGVAGGLLFATLGCYIIQAYKSFRNHNLMPGVIAAWIAIMVAGIFDTPFGPGERYYGNVLVGLLLGMILLLKNASLNLNSEIGD